jgi:prepilin-type N-terminal cleavage/methylation domain-containing protein
MKRQHGFTLGEMLVCVSILGLVAAIALPALHQMAHRAQLRLLAYRLEALLRNTQGDAATMSRGRAVRFTRRADGWVYTLHEDTNGNGVLNAEIASGVDTTLQDPKPLGTSADAVDVGFPPAGINDPDTGAPIDPGAQPVNFNRSALCSFSQDGSATPGSIYLSAGNGAAAAVRCSREGNIRTIYWDAEARTWSE